MVGRWMTYPRALTVDTALTMRDAWSWVRNPLVDTDMTGCSSSPLAHG